MWEGRKLQPSICAAETAPPLWLALQHMGRGRLAPAEPIRNTGAGASRPRREERRLRGPFIWTNSGGETPPPLRVSISPLALC